MLQIGRKLGESIIIADRIKVTVLDVSGKTVKLGFDYPADMQVHREEVYARIQDENRAAAQSLVLLRQLAGKNPAGESQHG